MSPPYTPLFLIGIGAILALIAVRLLHRVLSRGLDKLDISEESRLALRTRAEQFTRGLSILMLGLVAIAALSIVVERFNLDEPRWRMRDVVHNLMTHGVYIVLVIIVAMVVVRAARLALEHLQQTLGRRHAYADLEWERRARTISGILSRVVTVAVGFIAALMVFIELGVNVVPILGSAGIVGLAIGFGAQNLVRDVITGFFLILEDQVRIGDQTRINGVAGVVEEINLRTIVVRDGDGAVQVFPNGTITTLANLSKQYAFAVVDVRVAYTENLDRVTNALHDIGAAMRRDELWAPQLLAALDVTGVESLNDGFATIRIRFKTEPLNQNKVASELRRRVLTAFVALGIRPYAG